MYRLAIFSNRVLFWGSDYKRYSFHTAVNSQVKDWFKVGASISANQNYSDIGLGNSYGIIYNALLQAPDAAVYNADGSFAGSRCG